jgi:hypothetical protein
MKIVGKPLSEGYHELLNNMLVDGRQISFYYLQAPYPTEEPYILITGIHADNTNDDDSFYGDVTVDLNVYTCFLGDFGTMDEADAIANEMMARLIPSPAISGVTAEGFNIFGAKMIGSTDLVRNLDSKVTYEKRITIEHLIEQL